MDETSGTDSERERPTLAAISAVLAVIAEPRLVVGVDERIRMANAAAGKLLDRDPADLVGRPLTALVPVDREDQVAALRAAWLAAPVPGQVGRGMDLRARRRDGSEVPVEVQVASIATTEGSVAIVSLRDVTAVEHDTRLFRGLLESAPDAVVIVDESGRIRLVNATLEKWFGYTREELVGERVEVLVPEGAAARHAHLRGAYSARPHPRPLGLGEQLRARRKDGTEFPAEISLAPVRTDEGVLIVADIRDVTERLAVVDAMRRAEETQRVQEEATRVKDEFLATVSHELRTPLTSIVGFGELLEDAEDLPPRCVQFLSIIMRNARRELRLVNDLLMLVSINERGLTIRPAAVDLATVVREAADSARIAAAEAGLSVWCEVPDRGMVVTCDGERVGQALDNLLSNALKFTPRGGQVGVRLHGTDEAAWIEVSDSGMGISEEEHERVFERLYRSPVAVAQEIPGAGLGLSIAAAIAAAHRGGVRVLRSDESGTTFGLHLPLAGAVGAG